MWGTVTLCCADDNPCSRTDTLWTNAPMHYTHRSTMEAHAMKLLAHRFGADVNASGGLALSSWWLLRTVHLNIQRPSSVIYMVCNFVAELLWLLLLSLANNTIYGISRTEEISQTDLSLWWHPITASCSHYFTNVRKSRLRCYVLDHTCGHGTENI